MSARRGAPFTTPDAPPADENATCRAVVRPRLEASGWLAYGEPHFEEQIALTVGRMAGEVAPSGESVVFDRAGAVWHPRLNQRAVRARGLESTHHYPPVRWNMACRGRPPKLTPELAAEFCRLVGGGMSRAKAAASVGVTPKTVCLWMKAGREGRGAGYVHFVHEVRAAEARFVADQLTTVVRAAGPRVERVTRTTTRPDGAVTVEVTEREVCDWRAAMWLLQCKDPDGFGSDRRELAAVRKELAELRRTLAAAQGSTPSGVATEQG